MRVWTQAQYDDAPCRSGWYMLGQGDFRKVDFGGRHRVVIGSHSLLGNGVRLGDNCEIGDNCDFGMDFQAGSFLTVGRRCRFGDRAKVGEWGKISHGVVFGEDCEIAAGTQLADELTLPRRCRLFGVPGADGRTWMRISPVCGNTLHAFMATARDGGQAAYASERGGDAFLLDKLMMSASRMATSPESSSDQVRSGRELLAALKYVKTRMGLEELPV